jgi:ketosteroid isomerase-like protein
MSDETEVLKRVYDRFNARDMESVLAAMHEDVMWAMEWKAATSTELMECVSMGHTSGR